MGTSWGGAVVLVCGDPMVTGFPAIGSAGGNVVGALVGLIVSLLVEGTPTGLTWVWVVDCAGGGAFVIVGGDPLVLLTSVWPAWLRVVAAAVSSTVPLFVEVTLGLIGFVVVDPGDDGAFVVLSGGPVAIGMSVRSCTYRVVGVVGSTVSLFVEVTLLLIGAGPVDGEAVV